MEPIGRQAMQLLIDAYQTTKAKTDPTVVGSSQSLDEQIKEVPTSLDNAYSYWKSLTSMLNMMRH